MKIQIKEKIRKHIKNLKTLKNFKTHLKMFKYITKILKHKLKAQFSTQIKKENNNLKLCKQK